MAAQERDASSSGDEESGSRGALWAPGVEEDGSEFFSALSSFNTVGALDIAGGMRSLAEDRLKRANADLKAGADASRRVQVLDGEGKPSWATFKDSITRDDNKKGLLRVPGGLVEGFIGAICFTVFWVIVAGKKHLPNAIENLNENVITPTKAKLRPLVIQAKLKLDEAAERNNVPGWKKIAVPEEGAAVETASAAAAELDEAEDL